MHSQRATTSSRAAARSAVAHEPPVRGGQRLATRYDARNRATHGYFTVGWQGNRKGRWTWGQYCPMIPAADFEALFVLARAEGTILADGKAP